MGKFRVYLNRRKLARLDKLLVKANRIAFSFSLVDKFDEIRRLAFFPYEISREIYNTEINQLQDALDNFQTALTATFSEKEINRFFDSHDEIIARIKNETNTSRSSN